MTSSSIAEEMAMLPQLVSDTRITNYLTLSAFVVFLYDIILTFPEQLNFVWKAKWSSGKILFILNRDAADNVATPDMFDYSSIFDVSSHVSYRIMWRPVILILRTLALWERNGKILTILIATLVATDITIVVSISLITKSLSFENRPEAKPVLGCYGSLNEVSTSKAIPSWAALMIFDTTVFVLTVARVEAIRRARKDTSRLLHILFRDGIAFYIIMLASSIANLSLYAGLPLRRRGLIISLIPLLRTVMSVCAARLLLNLRVAAVTHCHTHAHWAFGELPSSSTMDIDATGGSRRTTPHAPSSLLLGRNGLDCDERSGSQVTSCSRQETVSERDKVIVSVHREEVEHRDTDMLPSSFRTSLLERLSTAIELRDLRTDGMPTAW
ncbi:hypothetical protein DFH11DRAFT_1517007 [Phellopilus nigrolimitatus]|nr:hypothetical protein DFH11DRAFT_1517007 [Phellopilus nigrolimitatus]